MNNQLVQIQDILMRELQRLDNSEYMKTNGKDEIARSNAISYNSETYLKSVLTNIRIMEISNKQNETLSNVSEKLGLTYNEK